MGKNKSIYDYLNEKNLKTWVKAPTCNCGQQGCANNHKLCALCGKTVIFGAYQELQPTSRYRWNIDHIKPWSLEKNNHQENLQVTHQYCNQKKANQYHHQYPNGYGILKNDEI